MSAWGIGVLVASASFLLQVYPRFVKPLFGIDVWRHLLIARFVKARGHLPRDGELAQHIFSEGTDYPPLLRWLIACFPETSWLILQRFLAPLFDFAHSMTLFGVVWGLSGNPWVGATAQIAYAVNPLIIMENSNLTTRSFSSLLFTWSLLPLLWYQQTGQLVWLGVAVVMLALLLLSHRLAVQAWVFLSILLTIADPHWVYAAVLAGAMLTATILSQEFYAKVLRGHLLMLSYWRRNAAHRFAHQIRGSAPHPQGTKDMVHEIYQWLAKLPALAVIAGFPMSWFGFLAAWLWATGILARYAILPNWAVRDGVLWGLGLLVTGMAIRQLPAIRFLGEGERYGEYAAFPVAALTATVVWLGPWAVIAFAAVATLGGIAPALLLQRKIILQDRERSITDDHQRIYGQVRDLMRRGPIRIASIPLGLVDALTYFTDCPVLATDSSLAHWRYYSDFTPVLRRPLRDLLAEHHMTHLLIDRTYVGVDELRLTRAKPLAESGPLVLLAVTDHASER